MDQRATEHRSLPSQLKLFLLVNVLASVVCVLCELVSWRLHLPNKYLKPWFVGLKFFDFLSFKDRFKLLHQPGFFDLSKPFAFAYPAPAALLYDPFLSVRNPRVGLALFLIASVALLMIAALLFFRAMIRRGVAQRSALGFTALATLLAFPFWFCFQRANIDVFVWAFLALGVFFFLRNRGYSAAACFGLAASLKLVPFVYLALFVPRRQWKQIAFGILLAAVVMVGSLAFIGPSIAGAWQGINGGLNAFNIEFVTVFRDSQVGFDHTLVSVYRRLFPPTPAFAMLLHRYTLAVAALGILLWLLVIRRLPMLNQIFALSIACVWLVPVSFEYTLTQLYLPLAVLVLLLLERNTADQTRSSTTFLVLCAILVSPISEFMHHGVGYGGQVQSLLLLLLFLASLIQRLPSRFDIPQPQPA